MSTVIIFRSTFLTAFMSFSFLLNAKGSTEKLNCKMLQLICDSISLKDNSVVQYVSHNVVNDTTGEITLVIDSMFTTRFPEAKRKALVIVDTLGFFMESCNGEYIFMHTTPPRKSNLDRSRDYYYVTDVSTSSERGISVSLCKMGTSEKYVYYILIKENIPFISRG